MKTLTTLAALAALTTTTALAGSYDPAPETSVRPVAAPVNSAGCRMKPIPGTNAWQRVDPDCPGLGFTSPDPNTDFVAQIPDDNDGGDDGDDKPDNGDHPDNGDKPDKGDHDHEEVK